MLATPTDEMSASDGIPNQSPPLVAYNVFDEDKVLVEAVGREGAGWATEKIRALGVEVGTRSEERRVGKECRL